MADDTEDAEPPWQPRLIDNLVVNYDSYSQVAGDVRLSSQQLLMPDSQPKFALKFQTAEACALFRAQTTQRDTELEHGVNTARSELAAVTRTTGTRELLDKYRGCGADDVRTGALQKIHQFCKSNPQFLPDLLAMIEEVPHVTVQGLDHVRQAIKGVEQRNGSLESRCATLTEEAATYDTSLRVLNEALRVKTSALERASSTDDKRTIQELRSNLLEAEKRRARLEKVAKNLLQTDDIEQIDEKLVRLARYDSLLNNAADELELPAVRRTDTFAEVLKELQALCVMRRKYKGLEQSLSVVRDKLKAAQDENSRLQKHVGGLESERNARDIADASSAEAIKEAQSNASTRISELEQDKQTQAHTIQELERKLVETEQFRIDTNNTAKQHAQQVEATASKQIGEAKVVADRRITEVLKQTKLDIEQARKAAADEKRSALDQYNTQHEDACRTLTAEHKIKLKDMEARYVKEQNDLRALLHEAKGRADAAEKRTQELESKNPILISQVANHANRQHVLETRNEQMKRICQHLLGTSDVDIEVVRGELVTSALASEFQARYGPRRDVQLICKLDDVLMQEENPQSVWDMAYQALTTPRVMSVSFLTALAQKLESANDKHFWFAMAMLTTFVTECSLRDKQMLFATSMVVLRCIEILVTAQVDLKPDVIERVERLLNSGCLVRSMLKCINGYKEGQHISLSSEISSWRGDCIRHDSTRLIPDEDNKSLLVGDDTSFLMIRRHQFNFEFRKEGFGIAMIDCRLAGSMVSFVPLSAYTAAVSLLQDGLSRFASDNPQIQKCDDSLRMRIDAEFLM